MFMDYSDFYPEMTDQGVKDLYKQCEIVRNMHFNYCDEEMKQELTSIGIVKVLELAKKGEFDPNRSSWKNYCYTAIRNEMKNHLYRCGKLVDTDDEILLGMNESHVTIEDTDSYIRITELHIPRISKETERKIKSSLNNMGFQTDEKDRTFYPEVERYVALAVWNKVVDYR